MSRGEMAVRVVTWNTHGGIGRDGRCDLERTLAATRELRPDILALQEIDGRSHFGRRPFAFERMREGLGGFVAEARLVGAGSRAYGHLLWSRWPLADVRLVRLPGGRFEARGVIDAVSRTPYGPLRVLAAHFGLGFRDRNRQARFVADLAGDAELPTVALGDFNDWRLERGAVHRVLGTALPVAATAKTWPAGRPFAALDRIYASGNVELAGIEAERRCAIASDHLPLIATIRF